MLCTRTEEFVDQRMDRDHAVIMNESDTAFPLNKETVDIDVISSNSNS